MFQSLNHAPRKYKTSCSADSNIARHPKTQNRQLSNIKPMPPSFIRILFIVKQIEAKTIYPKE